MKNISDPTDAANISDMVNGWMDHASLKWIFEEARKIPADEIIVEVGCWIGRSTTSLALAHPYPETLFVVDLFTGTLWDGHPECFDLPGGKNALEWFKENLMKFAGFLPQIIVGDSAESSQNFGDKSVSFCFIDADHDYKAVKADIISWIPKIKDGGIISGHDFHHGPIQKALNELFINTKIMSVNNSIWYVKMAH